MDDNVHVENVSPNRRFVVQKHQARTLHFDFRLEKEGVFKSWAVPKGLPEEAAIKRLAIQVEDHDLDFGDFEGTIPAGSYGAGHVEVWDQGGYDTLEWEKDRIVITLTGSRLNGRYVLIRFPRGGRNAWLLFKASAEHHARPSVISSSRDSGGEEAIHSFAAK